MEIVCIRRYIIYRIYSGLSLEAAFQDGDLLLGQPQLLPGSAATFIFDADHRCLL